MDYLLDTNIILIYVRQSELKEELDKQLNLFSTGNTLIISVVYWRSKISNSKKMGRILTN